MNPKCSCCIPLGPRAPEPSVQPRALAWGPGLERQCARELLLFQPRWRGWRKRASEMMLCFKKPPGARPKVNNIRPSVPKLASLPLKASCRQRWANLYITSALCRTVGHPFDRTSGTRRVASRIRRPFARACFDRWIAAGSSMSRSSRYGGRRRLSSWYAGTSGEPSAAADKFLTAIKHNNEAYAQVCSSGHQRTPDTTYSQPVPQFVPEQVQPAVPYRLARPTGYSLNCRPVSWTFLHINNATKS